MIRFAERLIARERFQEVLSALTPCELALVALLMDGLSVADAAELLGISRQAAGRRLARARRRIEQMRGEDDGREVG